MSAPAWNTQTYQGGTIPGRPFLRDATRNLIPGAMSEVELLNQLAPLLPALLMNVFNAYRPDNIAAGADMAGRHVAASGRRRARQARAVNPALADDLAFEADNQGNEARGRFVTHAYSPTTRAAFAEKALDLTDPGRLSRRLQLIAELTQGIHQTNITGRPKQGFGLGNLLQTGAQLYGMGAFDRPAAATAGGGRDGSSGSLGTLTAGIF
jgi:hypothetical protein